MFVRQEYCVLKNNTRMELEKNRVETKKVIFEILIYVMTHQSANKNLPRFLRQQGQVRSPFPNENHFDKQLL